MTDPEAGAITSPFVRQPHYNDLENRIRDLEAAIATWCHDGRMQSFEDRERIRAEMQAALSGARTAEHMDGCGLRYGGPNCTCGLAEIKSGARTANDTEGKQ